MYSNLYWLVYPVLIRQKLLEKVDLQFSIFCGCSSVGLYQHLVFLQHVLDIDKHTSLWSQKKFLLQIYGIGQLWIGIILQLCTLWYGWKSSTSRIGDKSWWSIWEHFRRGKLYSRYFVCVFSFILPQLDCDQRQKYLKHCFLLGRWTCFQKLSCSVSPLFELVFVSIMQTEKVRQEFSEDMSILRAFSIVFERRPDLRFNEINCTKIFYLLNILTTHYSPMLVF